MPCLRESLGPSIVGHVVGTYLLLSVVYKASSVRARGHTGGGQSTISCVLNEAQQAGGLALFSRHTNLAFLDSWTYHLRGDHGQHFCPLNFSLHICKMGRVGAMIAAGKLVSFKHPQL